VTRGSPPGLRQVWAAIESLADLLAAQHEATPQQVRDLLRRHEVRPAVAWVR